MPDFSPAVTFFSEALLPTTLGQFRLRVYRSTTGDESVALIAGDVAHQESVAVRVHSSCVTSETFGSLKCDCRQQLDLALAYIQRHGGMVIYLNQEGRGIGLGNKIKAYALQQQGHDTVSANEALNLPVDGRSYEAVPAILDDLGIRSVRLMTNNPDKISALKGFGVKLAGTIPVVAKENEHSVAYLETKRVRMGHMYGLRAVAAGPVNADVAQRPSPLASPRNEGTPFIHLNFAIRAPGTAQDEASKNVSCALDWARVHQLRERYAAIAVGATTWRVDKPRLTAREEHLQRPARRQPERVIFMGSKCYDAAPDGRRTFVIGSGVPTSEGCISVRAEGHDLAAPLAALREMAIESLFVEGGPTLLRSFLTQGVADEITIYVSTHTAAVALECAYAQFPGLPPSMEARRFGEGTLLHWIRHT